MTNKSILLTGFMATGKSSLAAIVAERAGVAWADTDAILEQRAGAKVAEVWRREGERAFRAREKEILLELLAGPKKVIACGGGTLLDRASRHAAIDRAIVVTLTASPELVVARAGDLSSRPNLEGADPVARARELLEARADAYAEAHGTLATDDVELEALADAVLAIAERDPVVMPLGRRSYAIDVVHERPLALTDAVAALGPSSLVVVTDAHVYRAQHRRLEAALQPLPISGNLVTLSPGESNKTIAAVMTIWDGALGSGVDRDTVVLAFGGGVVGDLAGFAAASLLRGVRLVQAPTTLLSMVDASVGGKTGFDHATGKNLIGAFHQPSAVVADLANLASLPEREVRAGWAEVVKIALTSDANLFDALERDADALVAKRPDAVASIVRRAIALKAKVVRDDETEQGARALLNLGHTFGHALEAATNYRELLHGEAVAAGTLAELAWTTARGWTPPDVLARTTKLLGRLGLTVDVSSSRWAAARRFIRTDKKRSSSRVRLPVVRAVGQASIERVDASALEAALSTVAAAPSSPG